MFKTVYGIHNYDDKVIFLTLDAAEDFLLKEYEEYCTSKDAYIDMCEQLIWENQVIVCEGCEEKSFRDDMDEYWIKPRCCDTWFCHEDCHG